MYIFLRGMHKIDEAFLYLLYTCYVFFVYGEIISTLIQSHFLRGMHKIDVALLDLLYPC